MDKEMKYVIDLLEDERKEAEAEVKELIDKDAPYSIVIDAKNKYDQINHALEIIHLNK